eukprot:2666717-Prymnesium_polylepis.1
MKNKKNTIRTDEPTPGILLLCVCGPLVLRGGAIRRRMTVRCVWQDVDGQASTVDGAPVYTPWAQ